MKIMWMLVSGFCSIHNLLQLCCGVTFIEQYPIYELHETEDIEIQDSEPTKAYPPVRSTQENIVNRRHIPVTKHRAAAGDADEKDSNLKHKIATLVQQTIHDTDRKIKSIQYIKQKYKETGPYKTGFILSMVKKSRDVLNELFNVGVKHRDNWKTLEQLKIFELIVHTNVDTTNLVRQLVEIHISHLNTTNSGRRIVLL